MLWTRHLVPFHRSARVPLLVCPTAVQAEGMVQDTSSRNVNAAPARRGVPWIRHLVPFHRSARLSCAPDRLTENPTAAQDDADRQATAIGIACREPAGAGIGSRRHLVPFHRSANGSCRPPLVTKLPTAVHDRDAEHDTPLSALTRAPAGLGVRWMAHLVPFHRSASVTPRPEAVTWVPTASHEEALVQVPNSNWPVGAFAFGAGTTDQPGRVAAGRASRLVPIVVCPRPTVARAGPADAATADAADVATTSPARTIAGRARLGAGLRRAQSGAAALRSAT